MRNLAVLILGIFSLVLMIGLVSAGFYPGSLEYNIDVDEEICKTLEVDLDSNIEDVYDVWAESSEDEWNLNDFDTEASEHGLVLDYPSSVSVNDNEVEICISGSQVGEHHGAIVFQQEQQGNSQITYGVWLLINVNEPSSPSGGGGGGGGGGGSTARNFPGTIDLRTNNFSLNNHSFDSKLEVVQDYDYNNVVSSTIKGVLLCKNFSDTQENYLLSGFGKLSLNQKEIWYYPEDNPFVYSFSLYGSCYGGVMSGVIIGEDIQFDGRLAVGTFYINGDYLEISLFIDQRSAKNNEKISELESWKQSIEDWKITLTDTINNLILTITGLVSSMDDHETRIVNLEGGEGNGDSNLSSMNYWSYLDFRTKEDIACGYATDNGLDLFKMQDLGASCEVDRGRCSCVDIKGKCELDGALYCYSWEFSRDDLTLDIKNTANDDIEVERIEVDGCEIYDRSSTIREGRGRRFRIECFDNFDKGNLIIEYRVEDGNLEISSGTIII